MTTADPKRTDEGQMVVPDFVIETIARALLPSLRDFYADPEGQALFEEYKSKKSGGKNND